MRDFRFRAWHKDVKEMLQNKHQGYEGNVFSWLKEGQPIEIMQYTGLKDKNDKEIYEGDIVYCNIMTPRNSLIEFIEGAFCATHSKTYPTDINFFYPSTGCNIEIIGNIYENPELIKEA